MPMRYERLGLPECRAEYVQSYVEGVAKYSPTNEREYDFGGHLQTHIWRMIEAALGFYLRDDVEQAAFWGQRLVAETDRYFFGGWRQHVSGRDADYWANGNGQWIKFYRVAVPFAFALGDAAAVRRLSGHPRESLSDQGDWRREAHWYLLLAEYLARGMTDQYAKRLHDIREGTFKGHRLCAEVLDTIAQGRNDKVEECFAEYFQYYLKHQKRREEFQFQLALDGTVFYHLAARLGRPIELDEMTLDHLLILE